MRHVEEARKRRDEKLRRTRTRQALRLLAFTAIVAAVVLGGYYVINADIWLVKTITVEGNEHLSAQEVVKLAGVDYKTNLLRLDGPRIIANIGKSPWVRQVELSRNLPNRLTIHIKERRRFVGLKQGARVLVLDDAGFVIQEVVALTETPLPVISDIRVPKLKVGDKYRLPIFVGALKSLKALSPDMRARATWVSVPSLEKLTFQTADGLEVVYGGPEEARKKNFVIKEILKKATTKIVHINVTAPDNPVVRKVKM